MPQARTIAIDGPAASGKSTVAQQLPKRIAYLYFDTGVMYRAVTLAALERLGAVSDEVLVTSLAEKIIIDVTPPSIEDGRMYDVFVDGRDVTWQIRSVEVEANVSEVSAYPGVRKALTLQQRKIGLRGAVVMVGRDIGTVVLPEAEIKVYLDATVEIRARRRYDEIRARGEDVGYDEILEAMKRRDKIDSSRTVSPLRPADDARIIMTDCLSVDEVVDLIFNWVEVLS